MTDDSDSLIFANRYRFEAVGNDWDRGRSGDTQLVYDLVKKRLGVIKKAEVTSKEAIAGLKNEIRALRRLKKYGVPRLYETGKAVYGSRKYLYMVIEYIDGMRVERNLDGLSAAERVAILAQFFNLLAQAHGRGIVNGDVDLKHLFWLRDSKRLVVVDWGNASLGINPWQQKAFAFDLARSAEIIYSLVTRKGPPSTGSLALPENAAPAPGVRRVPTEFRELCGWASQISSKGSVAPYTASKLMQISKGWLRSVDRSMPAEARRRRSMWANAAWLFIPVFLVLAYLSVKFFGPQIPFVSASVTYLPTGTPLPASSIPTLAGITAPSFTPPQTGLSQTPVPTLSLPSPKSYSPVMTFNDKLLPLDLRTCWKNESEASLALSGLEGLYRSYRDGIEGPWGFNVDKTRTPEQYVQADFKTCLGNTVVDAMALNAWIARIEPQKQDKAGNEFGFFVESQSGQRREYTLWLDQNEMMHLRVRESENQDYQVQVTAIQHGPRGDDLYDQFLVQIFLELDNQGSDIFYLLDGVNRSVSGIDPSQMVRIDNATRPALKDIQKIGLVGRGGKTDVLLLPLFFLNSNN